jgi:hypothetical protein
MQRRYDGFGTFALLLRAVTQRPLVISTGWHAECSIDASY